MEREDWKKRGGERKGDDEAKEKVQPKMRRKEENHKDEGAGEERKPDKKRKNLMWNY
jgi:hypothetical protein